MALEGVLANIPGLAGYLASQQYDQNRALGTLQGGLGMLNAAQSQERMKLMQQELALKELAEQRERQRLQLGQNLLGLGSVGQGLPPQAALAQGAAVGDVGPTVTNAQRMGVPQQGPMSVKSLSPEQVLGGGLLGLWKPADVLKIREMGRPAVEQVGGNLIAYDKDNPSGARVVASFPTTDRQGFSTMTVPDPANPGGFRVQVTPGAPEAMLTQQTTGERAKAMYDVVNVPQPDGTTRQMTREQFVNMVRGQQPQPSPQGQPQVFRVLDENSAAELAQQLQSNGVRNFQVTTRPSEQGQPASSAGMPGVTTGKTTEQTIEETARTAGRTELYKESTKRFGEFDGNIRSLGAVSRTLERLLALNQSGQTFTNAGANFKSQLSSIGQAIGLDINTDRLASSETYQAQIAELLKQRLGSKDYGSGTGVSNLDLIAASAPLPELVRSAQGQRQIIQALAQDTKESVEDMQAYRAWYRANRGNMDGFTYPSEARAQERLARIEQMKPKPEVGVQQPGQSQGNFEVGKVYRDSQGNRAIYRGNGQFEAVR